MHILALETSMTACSACLWQDGKNLAGDSLQMKHGHAEALAPLLERLQQESGVAWDTLDRIAVTTGPGSFTGLRVGLATARALSLALNIPAVGITVTRALAASVRRHCHNEHGTDMTYGAILAVIDTRRGDFYGELFEGPSRASLCKPDVFSKDALVEFIKTHQGKAPFALCGDTDVLDLPPDLRDLCQIVPTVTWPDPMAVADLAATESPSDPPTPVYIRPPNATPAPNGGQLRPG